MDEPTKLLTDYGLWGVIALQLISLLKDMVKIIIEESREKQRKEERKEQWLYVENLTKSVNEMHEGNMLAWAKANRAMELAALMGKLTPEGRKEVVERAIHESEAGSKNSGGGS